MNILRTSTITIVCAAVAAAAAGADPLTLSDALALAQSGNPGVRAAREEVTAAEFGIRNATAAWLPSLTASGSYGSFSGTVFFNRFIPGSSGEGTDIGPYDANRVVAVELKQKLYAGGAVSAAKRASGVGQQLAESRLLDRERDLEFEVTEAFYAVLLAESGVEVAQRSVDRSSEGLQMVRLRFEEQEALRVELLGAEGQLAADSLALLKAENALGLGRQSLNRLLGRAIDDEIELEGSLEDRVAVDDTETAIERAADQHPMVLQARLRADEAAAMLEQARSVARPKLELLGVYSWIDNELFFKGEYAGAVLNLQIPFAADFRAGSSAKGLARARQRQAEEMAGDVATGVRLATSAAFQSLEEAYATVAAARRQLSYQREKYRVSKSAFREQMITYSELLDGHSELSEAELALHAAEFRARLAEADVQRLVGQG